MLKMKPGENWMTFFSSYIPQDQFIPATELIQYLLAQKSSSACLLKLANISHCAKSNLFLLVYESLGFTWDATKKTLEYTKDTVIKIQSITQKIVDLIRIFVAVGVVDQYASWEEKHKSLKISSRSWKSFCYLEPQEDDRPAYALTLAMINLLEGMIRHWEYWRFNSGKKYQVISFKRTLIKLYDIADILALAHKFQKLWMGQAHIEICIQRACDREGISAEPILTAIAEAGNKASNYNKIKEYQKNNHKKKIKEICEYLLIRLEISEETRCARTSFLCEKLRKIQELQDLFGLLKRSGTVSMDVWHDFCQVNDKNLFDAPALYKGVLLAKNYCNADILMQLQLNPALKLQELQEIIQEIIYWFNSLNFFHEWIQFHLSVEKSIPHKSIAALVFDYAQISTSENQQPIVSPRNSL